MADVICKCMLCVVGTSSVRRRCLCAKNSPDNCPLLVYNVSMRLRNIPEAKEIVANSPYVIKNPAERRGMWKTFSGGPLYVEIGTGKGRFLMELAARHPENEYIGVEMYESVLMRACQKMEGRAARDPASKSIEAMEREKASPKMRESEDDAAFVPPQNLHFLRMDARGLPDVFAENEVAGIYLNFSDPWPKARHSKRRLTSHEFLALYEKFLIDGGVLEFKTDNRALFDFSVEEFNEAPNWELRAVTYDLHRDEVMGEGNIMTEYERKFSLLGNKINKLIAVYKRPAAKEHAET